jgi:hypothetical protein
MHDLGNGEKVPCKLNSFEYPDQKYTHCELCELDMNEAIENWDDRNYNSDPYYLDESTYEWAMEQDNG